MPISHKKRSAAAAKKRAEARPDRVFFSASEALEEVALENGSWNWALVSPELDDDELDLCSGGRNGIEEMKESLARHPLLFGLLRVQLQNEDEKNITRFFVVQASNAEDDEGAGFTNRQRGLALSKLPQVTAKIQKFAGKDNGKLEIKSAQECAVDHLLNFMSTALKGPDESFVSKECYDRGVEAFKAATPLLWKAAESGRDEEAEKMEMMAPMSAEAEETCEMETQEYDPVAAAALAKEQRLDKKAAAAPAAEPAKAEEAPAAETPAETPPAPAATEAVAEKPAETPAETPVETPPAPAATEAVAEKPAETPAETPAAPAPVEPAPAAPAIVAEKPVEKPARQRKPIKAYKPGDQVEVWSNKVCQWVADGEVVARVDETTDVKGIKVPAGSVRVVYNKGRAFRWIPPALVEEALRDSVRPRPPDAMTGMMLKQTHGLVTQWHERYFEINKGYLQWWDDKKQAQSGAKGRSIYLLGARVLEYTNTFKLSCDGTKGVIYHFGSTKKDKEDMREWSETVLAHSEYCEELHALHEAEKRGRVAMEELAKTFAKRRANRKSVREEKRKTMDMKK